MFGFCGILNLAGDTVSFSELKRMMITKGFGCAFINNNFGVMCYGMTNSPDALQPLTLKYNNALYTAAVFPDNPLGEHGGSCARRVIEGYIEGGDEFIRRGEIESSACLYDARCGELMLVKKKDDNASLLYGIKDTSVFFSTSITAIMRIFGGCVRVSKTSLGKFLTADYSTLPSSLFCDISPISNGHCLLCSRFGVSDVPIHSAVYSQRRVPLYTETMVLPKSLSLRNILTNALLCFGYPQFDALIPSLEMRINQAYAVGETALRIPDPFCFQYPEYCAERLTGMGAPFGIRLTSADGENILSKKFLRSMEKQLDELLTADSICLSNLISELNKSNGVIESAYGEKDAALRIRKKAMLWQTALWKEHFNVVFI